MNKFFLSLSLLLVCPAAFSQATCDVQEVSSYYGFRSLFASDDLHFSDSTQVDSLKECLDKAMKHKCLGQGQIPDRHFDHRMNIYFNPSGVFNASNWELRCSDLNIGSADGSIRKNNYPAPIVDIAMSVARNEKSSTVKLLSYDEFKKFESDNFNFLLGKSDRGSETIYYFDLKQNYSRCVYFYATTEEIDLSGESAEIVRLGLFSFEEIKAATSTSKYMNERMVALCEEL